MMLHNGRCGSTVVGNLLAQNPNIYCGKSFGNLVQCHLHKSG